MTTRPTRGIAPRRGLLKLIEFIVNLMVINTILTYKTYLSTQILRNIQYFPSTVIMTFSTSGFNIEPVFGFITVPMMPLLCLLGAIRALKGARAGKFASGNSVIHGITGFIFKRKFLTAFSSCDLLCEPAFFTLGIPLSVGLAFFALSILLYTGFAFFTLGMPLLVGFAFFTLVVLLLAGLAITTKSVFAAEVFAELRKKFMLLAVRTSFHFNTSRSISR